MVPSQIYIRKGTCTCGFHQMDKVGLQSYDAVLSIRIVQLLNFLQIIHFHALNVREGKQMKW